MYRNTITYQNEMFYLYLCGMKYECLTHILITYVLIIMNTLYRFKR